MSSYKFKDYAVENTSDHAFMELIYACVELLRVRGDVMALAAIASFAEQRVIKGAKTSLFTEIDTTRG